MHIRWDYRPRAGPAPTTAVQIWNVPKATPKRQPIYVRLLGEWWSVFVHWSIEGRTRTLPCFEQNCPLCPRRSFRVGYAPALVYQGPEGNTQMGWRPIIATLPDRVIDAHPVHKARGTLLSFWREGRPGHDWIGFDVLQTDVKELEYPAFDVEPVLRRVWGYEERRQQLEQRADGVPPGPAAPPPAPEVNGQAVPPPQAPTMPPPPPRPTRPSSSAPTPALSSEIRAILARAQEAQKGHQKPYEDEKPAVLPFRAVETPPEPQKPARKRRKGGAS